MNYIQLDDVIFGTLIDLTQTKKPLTSRLQGPSSTPPQIHYSKLEQLKTGKLSG